MLTIRHTVTGITVGSSVLITGIIAFWRNYFNTAVIRMGFNGWEDYRNRKEYGLHALFIFLFIFLKQIYIFFRSALVIIKP